MNKYLKYSFKSLLILFLVVYCLFPFIWMIIVSLVREPDFLMIGKNTGFSFANYQAVLSSSSLSFFSYLKNSLFISFISAVIATFCSSLSAYAFTRFEFRGKIFLAVLVLALSMFPQISIMGFLFKMMTGLRLINTYPGLVFPYTALALPLAFWIMLTYFKKIPLDLDKSALIDGASRFQVLTKIIIPVALPGIISTLILTFIFSFNEFLFALILTIDTKARTIPVAIALFEGLHGQIPWGQIMAASVLAILPVFVLVGFMQRYVIQGLTYGALKE
ncbi:carbohydrate ABC transporter permease [Candidatus Margulisiibacteriota bacterium]